MEIEIGRWVGRIKMEKYYSNEEGFIHKTFMERFFSEAGL